MQTIKINNAKNHKNRDIISNEIKGRHIRASAPVRKRKIVLRAYDKLAKHKALIISNIIINNSEK